MKVVPIRMACHEEINLTDLILPEKWGHHSLSDIEAPEREASSSTIMVFPTERRKTESPWSTSKKVTCKSSLLEKTLG